MGMRSEPGGAVAKLLRYSSEAVVENVLSVPGFSAWNEVVLPNLRYAMEVGPVNWERRPTLRRLHAR